MMNTQYAKQYLHPSNARLKKLPALTPAEHVTMDHATLFASRNMRLVLTSLEKKSALMKEVLAFEHAILRVRPILIP
jgi:hypothetical protein